MDDNHDEALKRKRELYAGMDSSTNSEDDEATDPGREASIQAMQKAATRKQNKPSNGLARSVSDSKLAESQRPPPPAPSRIDTRPLPTSSAGNVRLPTSLMTRQTFSGTGSKSMANVVPSSVSKFVGIARLNHCCKFSTGPNFQLVSSNSDQSMLRHTGRRMSRTVCSIYLESK